MDGYLTNPLVFLVSTAFDLYILAVLLRFLLQLVRADFYNPVSQFLVKITQPVLRPLRRVIPGLGGIDMAAVLLLFALQLVAIYVVGLIRAGVLVPLAPAIVGTVAQLIELVLNVYFVVLIVQAILSWVQTGYNPVASILYSLSDPILRPIRRVVPTIGGLDLSPLVAIIGIQLAKMLILPPLHQLARAVY